MTDGPLARNAPSGTIAFESVDGPPVETFQRLVAKLDGAAQTRNLAIVSRDAPAQYRVRAYLATHVQHARTTVAWTFDIYDAEQHRALRVSGQESGRRGARDWSAADDKVLQRIADGGIEQLADLVGAPPGSAPASPAAPPGRDGAPVQTAAAATGSSAASSDGPSGIFALLQPARRDEDASAMPEPALAPEDVPLPHRRPPVARADASAATVASAGGTP